MSYRDRSRSPLVMLPLPGSPSSSWALYKERLRVIFHGADPRVCLAFWLFGIINNVLYVIILSSALDLVGPRVPKGVVLLFDVMPSFGTKLIAPYFIHLIPYPVRIFILVALSTTGMLIIALSPMTTDASAISTKMAGVMLASLSSGGGEMTFLSLTHFYGHFSLAAWGSGTGTAGLVGAGAYALATNSIGLSVRTSLLAFSLLPAVMFFTFFGLLPLGPLRARKGELWSGDRTPPIIQADDIPSPTESQQEGESEGLLTGAVEPGREFMAKHGNSKVQLAWLGFMAHLRRVRGLVVPYMIPLLLVYIGEYTINQGVSPTLLFPLSSSPFRHYRAFYPTYNALYQVGVFLSRSSTPFVRIHHLYLPSLLQVLNLVVLTLHALFDFVPTVWIIFAIVFWEGLLGGAVYVNAFAEITDKVPEAEREFSLGAASVSDSAGICIAGFLGMAMEVWLCDWQVRHGRDYCRRE